MALLLAVHAPPNWQGGFDPKAQSVYPAVRDTKAAIRWFRAHADQLGFDPTFVGGGGWSAGACTTAHLASSFEWVSRLPVEAKHLI